jgi:hypothetical protein
MFEIAAQVEGFGLDKNFVCCFDPNVVIVRLRSRVIAFLHELCFAPCVHVKSVRVEDNDAYPA